MAWHASSVKSQLMRVMSTMLDGAAYCPSLQFSRPLKKPPCAFFLGA